MDFPPFDLLDWFIQWLPSARYDIGASGMMASRLDDLDVTFEPADVAEPFPGGGPDLRELLAERYGVSRREVLVTAGASEANFLAYAALLSPGAVALVEHPTYTPLRKMTEGLGARMGRVIRSPDDGFRLPIDHLPDTKDVRLLSLTSPNNPTGVADEPRDLQAIADACSATGTTALVDEVFLALAFERAPPTAVSVDPRFLITSSLTKLGGLGGLRVGWAVGPAPVIQRMERIAHHLSVAPSRLGERVVLAALEREAELVARAKGILAETRPLVEAWIEATEGVSWVPPDVGNFGYPRVEGADMTAVATRLAQEHRTVIAPGAFFGHEDRFRLGFGTGVDHVQGGLAALTALLAKR
jgi:aspartate/methionine/tyrosine aminotransferase